jgi:hypothetical protein
MVLDTRPLELITDLSELSSEPSEEFLKFAEIIFANRKADPKHKHNHSFNSYLLRIPYTYNSKCINKNEDPEVKIIQRFDPQIIPQINTYMLREFRLYIAELDIKNKRESIQQEHRIRVFSKNSKYQFTNQITQSYQWIETLLQTPIPDHRKSTVNLTCTIFA